MGGPNGARRNRRLHADETLYRHACLTASVSLSPFDCRAAFRPLSGKPLVGENCSVRALLLLSRAITLAVLIGVALADSFPDHHAPDREDRQYRALGR